MSSIRFEKANILTAFDEKTIGSKVTDPVQFAIALTAAVESYDASHDRAPGQHFVMLPESAWTTVSAGVGKKSKDPGDYVIRVHRDQPTMFLKRENAADVEGLACVVYTRDAYLNDPDVLQEPDEMARIEASDCTHVIVAVLAFAGPQAPLSPHRLVHNLAGGNREAESWTMDDVRTKAAESISYWNEWEVVAD
jgi:hypothetical protein